MKNKTNKPKVLIPVFPGTNCEYDSARAVEKAGGEAEIFVIRNLTAEEMCIKMRQAEYAILPSSTISIEALACGTPVLTFDATGSAENVPDSCGAVVSCDDIDCFERKIKEIFVGNEKSS